jgi:superfamily II DNA helicase RecQ
MFSPFVASGLQFEKELNDRAPGSALYLSEDNLGKQHLFPRVLILAPEKIPHLGGQAWHNWLKSAKKDGITLVLDEAHMMRESDFRKAYEKLVRTHFGIPDSSQDSLLLAF